MAINKTILALAIAAAAGIGYKWWKDSKTVRHGKLVKKTWSESVKIQEYREVTEKGKFVPDGAEVISRATKTNIDASKILETINFNTRTGRFSIPDVKTETVYQYKVKKWVTIDTKTITGMDSEPHKPEITLENEYKSGSPELGQRRIVSADSKRGVVFADEDGVWHDLAVSDSDYHSLQANDTVFFKKVFGAYSLVGAEFGKKEAAVSEPDTKIESGTESEGCIPATSVAEDAVSEDV